MRVTAAGMSRSKKVSPFQHDSHLNQRTVLPISWLLCRSRLVQCLPRLLLGAHAKTADPAARQRSQHHPRQQATCVPSARHRWHSATAHVVVDELHHVPEKVLGRRGIVGCTEFFFAFSRVPLMIDSPSTIPVCLASTVCIWVWAHACFESVVLREE